MKLRMRATIGIMGAAILAALLMGATPGSAFPRKDTAPAARTTAKRKATGKKSVARSRQPAAQMAPTRERIAEIQSALTSAGSYQGEANGKWDAATIDAVTHFQTSHGLTPTGKINALTLQKLGLGSETAGRAAPTPGPESSTPTVNLGVVN